MLTHFLPPCSRPISRMLLLMGLGLVGLHLGLIVAVTHNPDQFVLSLLFWGAIATQAKRPLPHRLGRSRSATVLGAVLLGLLVLLLPLLNIWHLDSVERAFVRLFPLVAFTGWALLVGGWRLFSRWQSWVLVLALSVPPRALPLVLETLVGPQIRSATAAIAAFGLHYVGFEVVRQGSLIQLPNGAIDVEFACTGAALLGLLLQMSVLIAAMTGWRDIGRLVGGAVAIATVLSIIRVAIMAMVVSNTTAFQFWHGPDGGQLFTLIALAGLGGLGSGRLASPQGR